MYESYWQLAEKPFQSGAHPRFYYPSEVHQGALLKLRYGIEHRGGAVLLAGAAGLGKTLLVESLRRQLPECFSPVVHLVYPQMPTEQLLAYLAEELDGTPGDPAAALSHSVRRIATALTNGARQGRHALIVLDEAHLLTSAETFEALRLLLNFECDAEAALTILLCGQTGLLPTLDRMPGLEQRLGVKCLLRPLTLDETAGYVDHRLRTAGAKRTIFDATAIDTLYQLTRGVPRQINRLCDLALLIAYAEEQQAISGAQLESVSEELLTVTPE